MDIKIKNIAPSVYIMVYGSVTGLAEVAEIKEYLTDANEMLHEVKLEFVDAYVIPSSLIGYLIKLSKKEGVKVTIVAHTKDLKELLDDLQIDSVFSIHLKTTNDMRK